MHKTAIFLFVIFLVSCSKDNGTEHSNGTKITYIEFEDGNERWIENYSYSTDGKVVMIENSRSLGIRYEMEYENFQLKEYSTYRMKEEKLIFRDSIVYNANGTVRSIHNFSINSGENLPLTRIYEYEYDIDDRVAKKSTYLVSVQEYTSKEKYYWAENNIERVEYYNGEEELYYEFFYKYDDKINYKRANPTSIKDPINWGENNVREMNWNDYLGNLDLVCKPCLGEYKYNVDKYPVSIEMNWGLKMKMTYK